MDHKGILEKLCRVCGRQVVTKSSRVKHLCADYENKLQAVFNLSMASNNVDTHPRFFCHSYKIVMFKSVNAVRPYRLYQHRTAVFKGWCSHTDGSCMVCQHYKSIQVGGRSKKVKHTAGRPPSVSPRYCINHVHDVAPPTETINIRKQHQRPLFSELTCPICNEILRCPIELVTCNSVVCAECMCGWLQHQQKLVCPCCYSDHLREYEFTTGIREATLFQRLLGSLCHL